MIRITT